MDKLQFKISSALKDLVGKDLIRNDNIADLPRVLYKITDFSSYMANGSLCRGNTRNM